MTTCKLALPLPTSLNKLYTQQWSGGGFTGKKILSKVGEQNRYDIMLNVEKQISLPINLDWDVSYTKDHYIFMDIEAYVTRSNVDLDNTLKTLNDSIQATGLVFIDDKKVVPRFNRVYIDPDNPRVELTFTQTGWNGIFDNFANRETFENNCKTCSRYRNGSCSILKKSLDNKILPEIKLFDNKEDEYYCTAYKEKK